jgi:hypothetical protein
VIGLTERQHIEIRAAMDSALWDISEAPFVEDIERKLGEDAVLAVDKHPYYHHTY